MTEPMHLYPAVRPALTARRYQLKTSQTITGGGLGTRVVDDRTQHIDVTAPRTTMAPDEVFSVVPPPHAQGPFEGRLPHITLKRRTLPWDRSVPDKTGPPWLALVMLAEGEGTFRRGEQAADCYSDGIAATLPDLDTDVRGDCIEVTRTIVDRTFPARDEVDLLCHVREADARDTELADEDHWVSVVLCNRLPQAGTAYRCMLISLEGQHDVLPATGGAVETPSRFFGWDDIFLIEDVPLVARVVGDGFSVVPASVNATRSDTSAVRADNRVRANPTGAAGRNRTTNRASESVTIGAQGGFVRLDVDTPALLDALVVLGRIEEKFRFPVLATWEFECSDVPGDFGGLMARLDVALLGDQGNQSADPRRVLPTTAVTGHLALEHTDRRGDTGTAWYRSPCAPVKITREPAGSPFHVADQARRVGSDGREDLSLAAAFEVGRLLAMSDPQFLASLRRWARKEFALRRDNVLLDGLVDLTATFRDDRFVDLGRILAADILGRGGIGGPPIELLGQPLLVHPDARLTQPGDIRVLATGFGVAEATVKQLAGDAISDRAIDTGPAVGGGLIDVGDAVGAISGLRNTLDAQVVDRLDRVLELERRLGDDTVDLGRLGDLLEGRP